jgi:LuxR family maltose regulon positive regulatory protein
LVLGRLDEAETWASQSLTVADDRGWTEQPNAAIGYLVTGTLHLLRGDPTEAERLLRNAGAACREPLTGIAIMIARTLLDASRDRPQAALRSARAAHEAVQELSTQPIWLTRWLGIATVEADLAAGQQATVAAQPDPDPGAAEAGDQWTLRQTVHAARAQLALNDAQRADRMLRKADTGTDHPLAGVDLWLATALAADRLRDDHRAREAITRAVHIAAPQRICLPFLTFDRSRVPQLLERLVDSESTHAGFVNDLLRLSAPTGQPHIEPVPLREPLTARELAVLELLPTMQSNNEIADEMFVSVNTVKAHLKGLYRKLDVQNRRSAVHRGRTLQLIA